MKKLFLFLLLVCLSISAKSQTGLGSTSFDAMILKPITATQRLAIANPKVGMMVYQSDGVKGNWCYTATGWTRLTTQNDSFFTDLEFLAPKLNPIFTGNRLVIKSNTPTVMMTNTANNADINVLELSANQEVKLANGGLIIQGNGGTNSMYIQNNGGNVGIGTNTPTVKLDVVGNGKFSGNLTASNLSGSNTGDETNSTILTKLGYTPYNATNPIGFLTSSALTPYLTSGTASTTYQPIGSYLTSISSANITTALGYTPYNATNPSGFLTSSALTPYLTSGTASTTYQPIGSYLTSISSANITTALGFTPYNATNPSGYSTLSGTQTFTGSNTFNGNTVISSVSGNTTTIGNSSSGIVTINSGSSAINIGNEASSTGTVNIGNTTSGQRTVYVGGTNASSQTFIQGGSGGGTYFKAGSTEIMRISGTGYVGIKNISPSTELDVTGVGRFTRIVANTTNSGLTPNISTGSKLLIPNYTNIDAVTASSGTLAHSANIVFARPTFASTNTNVTNGISSNVYIEGEPIAGTNTTINNPFAFYVARGDSYFGANLKVSNNVTALNYNFIDGQYIRNSNITNGNGLLYLDATNLRIRRADNGTDLMSVLSSGNVGIGTITPTGKLDVRGTGYFWDGTTTKTRLRTGGIIDFTNVAEDAYAPALLSASQFSFTGGNVGIGTSNPLSSLHINGGKIITGTASSTGGSTLLEGLYDQGGANGALAIIGTNASSGGLTMSYGIRPKPSNSNGFTSTSPLAIPRSAVILDEGFRYISGGAQTIAIGSDATLSEKFTISNSGNVGINNNSPQYLLDVNGNANISNAVYLNGVNLANSAGNFSNNINARVISNSTGNTPNNDGMYINYGSSGGGMARIFDGTVSNYVGIGASTFSTSGINKFLFGTQTDDGTANQFAGDVRVKGVLNLSNNLGFENSQWQYWKDNGGTYRRTFGMTSTNNFIIGDIDNTITGDIFYQSKNAHVFRNNLVETVRIAQNGNVGIGTASPNAKLTLGKSDNLLNLKTWSNSDLVGFEFYQATNFPTTSSYGRVLDINAGSGNSGGSSIRFLTAEANDAGSTRLLIDKIGNVGIGTTAPTSLLDLKVSSGNSAEIRVGSIGVNTDNAITITRNPSYTEFLRIGSSAAGGLFGGVNNSYLVDVVGASVGYARPIYYRFSQDGGTTYNTTLTVSTNGVGFGTTNPQGIIDAVSTTQPSYPFPRMNSGQITVLTGMTAGAFVFNTSTGHPNYFNGSSWVQL